MPYVTNQDVRIHYEVEGKGPPLMLLHGIGEDMEWWREYGYVDLLRGSYRLILVDVRGHGSSDKPHDPNSYSLEVLVEDAVKVLDALDIPKAHFFGYSMGGWIGYGIGKHAQERFHSLIISAMSPYRDRRKPNNLLRFFSMGLEFVWNALEEKYGRETMKPKLRDRWMNNDLHALLALLSKDWMTNLEGSLQNIRIPCLLLVGEIDPYYQEVRRCVTKIPNATLVSFPNIDHMETLYRSDLTTPHVKSFLAGIPPTFQDIEN